VKSRILIRSQLNKEVSRLTRLTRRDFAKSIFAASAIPAAAAQEAAARMKGLPPLTIKDVKVIATNGGRGYHWVFLKIITSEPGLYGIGSMSNNYQSAAVVAAAESNMKPFLIGKDPARIEDLWQGNHVRSYWRNGTVGNNLISGMDMALWDIKGKRAGMPVYDLLGGKVRDTVPIYAHAGGKDIQAAEDDVRKYWDDGYTHIRVQVGGYGGGGFVPPGQGSRADHGYTGPAFDEDIYADNTVKLFDHMHSKFGPSAKFLHDIHEHLTPTMAVDLAKRLEPFHMFFVEDILPPEQIDWFRRIKEVCTTPLAMGELFVNPLEYVPLIANRYIDFIRTRVSQIGGITQAKKIANLCETFGVRTAFQEGGDNDPVNQLAAYHVDISSAGFGIQEENHFPPLVHEMLPGTAEQRKGYLYGTNTPGLGIDINEEIAAKYPIQHSPNGDNYPQDRTIDGAIVKP
jgi:mannonate dehydratase